MQNLLGGLIQVQLFMLQIHYRDFVWRTLQREERHIKVANRVQAEVEAIEELPLSLQMSFMYPICIET